MSSETVLVGDPGAVSGMREHSDVHATLSLLDHAAMSSGDPGDVWVWRAAIRVHLVQEHGLSEGETADPVATHEGLHALE